MSFSMRLARSATERPHLGAGLAWCCKTESGGHTSRQELQGSSKRENRHGNNDQHYTNYWNIRKDKGQKENSMRSLYESNKTWYGKKQHPFVASPLVCLHIILC